MFTIVAKEMMADGSIFSNEIEAPQIAKKAQPGQFVIVKANETGERVPLTMAEVDKKKGTITIIYMVVGKSTRHFSSLEVGEGYQDIVGPLGSPTHIEKFEGKVVCVGGGTGTAVLHPITRANYEKGNNVTTILGARSERYLILEDKMSQVSHDLKICTDDGSKGHHGFVTDELKKLLEEGNISQVVAIGPVPMMKFVSMMTKEYKVPTIVSLNPIMIDGTGMCGGCRVTIDKQIKFACVDGPEFDGHQVDYDSLIRRLGAYALEEQCSDNEYCKLNDN
ncbi:MAG: sulfide/dihydroorotate dehydrogenase-like FAD/NAD-binding protein [Campylobacterota bacterium]|nr:sulfide/dihydroorotate dehydrogenase-like FAD/NAD-binding protein [Campylobacterota bacterium]